MYNWKMFVGNIMLDKVNKNNYINYISDKTEIKTGEYNIDYVGDTELSFSEIEPMYDENVNIDTKDNVIRLEFSLRGGSQNKNDDLIYDVMLNEMNIDCSLLNEYTKWNLYKNGKLISNGSLSPGFDGNVLGSTMRLTNIQEDLPKYNQEYDKYFKLSTRKIMLCLNES